MKLATRAKIVATTLRSNPFDPEVVQPILDGMRGVPTRLEVKTEHDREAHFRLVCLGAWMALGLLTVVFCPLFVVVWVAAKAMGL